MDEFKPLTEKIEDKMQIRIMEIQDRSGVSKVHKEVFPRQMLSEKWIECSFNAYPRIRYFVADDAGEIIGYIQWIEKSGFRKEVILELEQMGVLPSRQKQGIGSSLITQSLKLIKDELKQREATIKHILVTTRADNAAQKLYEKTLNAIPEAVISNLYSADEVIMISRNPII